MLGDNEYHASWLARGAAPEAAALFAENRGRALADGVFGSPSHVLDGEIFWGQDRLDLLGDALTSQRPAFAAGD